MLPGRLGLETARLPHSDRHGLVSLDRGRLAVEEGCLTFDCAGGGVTPAGRYGLPRINSFRLSCWAPDRASATTCRASSPGTEWGWWRPARTACASIPRNRCCQTSPTSPAPTGCNGNAARTMSTATPLRNAQGGDFLHLYRQSRQYHISRAVFPVHVGRSVPENIFASLVADLIALGQGLQQVAQLGEMPLRLMPTFSERTQRLI